MKSGILSINMSKEASSSTVPAGLSEEKNPGHSDEDQDQTAAGDVKEAIKLYQESASIHGVANILGPQVYSFRRPIWMVLVIAMATLMTWTLYNQLTELKKYPFKTDIKVSLQDQLPFPAVTICSLNQYYKKRVPDNEMIKNVIFHQSEYAYLTNAYSRLPDLDNMTDVSGEELVSMARTVAPSMQELFFMCDWQSQRYRCQDIFEPVQTSYGTCYTFNEDKAKPRIATGSGSGNGLWLILDFHNRNSYFSRNMQAGIKIIVHQQNVTVFPSRDGWTIRPGVSAKISLTRTDTIRLPYPYKAFAHNYCEDTKREGFVNKLTMYDSYSSINCQAECRFAHLAKTCGCKGYHDPGDAKVCSGKEYLKCYIPARRSIKQSDSLTCDCPHECDSVDFSADLDYADFASRFIEEVAVQQGIALQEALRVSTVDVKIFFKTLDITMHEQKPAVSVQDIVGSLGGQMGLFLGASIISMVEILEMLMILLARCIHRCRSGEEARPKTSRSSTTTVVPAWQVWATSRPSRPMN